MNLDPKRNFILNLVTAFIWLVAGIACVVLNGKYTVICFVACIVFGYLSVTWYKRWKAQ